MSFIVIFGILYRLEMPAGSHHLFHQQRGRNSFQEVVHSYFHITLFCIRHGYHVYKLGRLFAFTVTCTSSYYLDDLCQRATYSYRQTYLTPLPVKSFLGCTQGDDDVHILLVPHALQIALHHVAFLLVILHQVSHLQQSSVLSPDMIDACIVIFILNRPYCLHDFIGFSILADTCRGTGVHAGNMDNGLLRGVQHFTDVVQIVSMIEVITQHQILQIPIAIQLLIVVIGDRMESGLVLHSQHRNTIATKVTARHGHDMPCGVVHHASHHIAKVRVGISRGMVELINGQQCVVEVLIRDFLHAVAQRGVGTHQDLRALLMEEFDEAPLLVLLVLHVRQVEVGCHLPVSEEALWHQPCVLKRASNALFRHGHHHTFQSLVHQLVQGDEHQRTALARCWRSFD